MRVNTEILPDNQQKLFNILKNNQWISEFYLAGGTGLALQYNHRKSVDFDFFNENNFTNEGIIEKLKSIGEVEILSEAKNTLHALVNNVRISFLGYKYPLLKNFITEGQIKIADHLDIACMKLSAIASRSTKKDFVDLYFLLKNFKTTELFNYYEEKYNVKDYTYILLKSLVYFEDADQDPMPVLYDSVRWEEVKHTITKEVQKIGKI